MATAKKAKHPVGSYFKRKPGPPQFPSPHGQATTRPGKLSGGTKITEDDPRWKPKKQSKPKRYQKNTSTVSGNKLARYHDEPTYKPKLGYKDAPGGKIYGGQLSYDQSEKGRRKT